VANALSPSKVLEVQVNEDEKATTVIVPDYQLSLAIGKRGQNARLAAKLTGWKIDIKSEEEKRQEAESAMAALVAPGTPAQWLLSVHEVHSPSSQRAALGLEQSEWLRQSTHVCVSVSQTPSSQSPSSAHSTHSPS
jgi:predicted PilT family ATPase